MPSVCKVRVPHQREQKKQAQSYESLTKEARRIRHDETAILHKRVDFEQTAGINQKQREEQEEENSLELPGSSMPQNQRQQKQINQRPSSQTDESDIEE